MIYLYAYFGMGLALFAWVYLTALLKTRGGERAPAGPLGGIGVAHTSFWDRVLDEILMVVLGLVWVATCWPWFIYWKVKEWVCGSDVPAPVEDPVFAVEKAHLLERVTVEEVEARETVFDPLRAAPTLPFGHLHPVWRAFADQRMEGDELWSFSADWRTGWGNMERRAGYVLVREGAPGDHFLTTWKDLAQEEDRPGGSTAKKLIDIPSWLRSHAD